MSGFGWSGNDIAVLVKLGWSVVQNTRSACGQYAELSQKALGLYTVLVRLETELKRPESPINRPGDSRRDELNVIVSGCKQALTMMDHILDKYLRLSEPERSIDRLYRKVRFGNSQIAGLKDLQTRVVYYTSLISLFVNMVSSGSLGRVEKQMEEAGGDLKEIKLAVHSITAHLQAGERLEGSVLSSISDDHSAVWSEIRRELRQEGVRSSVIREHKKVIKAYVLELWDRGLLDEVESVTVDRETENYEDRTTTVGGKSISTGGDDKSNYEGERVKKQVEKSAVPKPDTYWEPRAISRSVKYKNRLLKHGTRWTATWSEKIDAEIFYKVCAAASTIFPERGLRRMRTQFSSIYKIRLEVGLVPLMEQSDKWLRICATVDGALIFQPSSERSEIRYNDYEGGMLVDQYDIRTMLIFDFQPFIHDHIDLIEEGMHSSGYPTDFISRVFSAMKRNYRPSTPIDFAGQRSGTIFYMTSTESNMFPALMVDSKIYHVRQGQKDELASLESTIQNKETQEADFKAVRPVTDPSTHGCPSGLLDTQHERLGVGGPEEADLGKSGNLTQTRGSSKREKSTASGVLVELRTKKAELVNDFLARSKEINRDIVKVGKNLAKAENQSKIAFGSLAMAEMSWLMHDLRHYKSELYKIDPKITQIEASSSLRRPRKIRSEISNIIDVILENTWAAVDEFQNRTGIYI